ncbi:MAG TPA: translocation/assembly module TamB domain-containing protein [Acidobacteriaceae bacterium]|nr:translocation/assembly module TamB domain-containing protein [Acidobacteriaceae bacterium]
MPHPTGEPEPLKKEEAPPPKHPHRIRNLVAFGALWTVVVLLVLFGAVAWYASTSSFQNRVRRTVIAELEKSTGGRVELKKFGWRLTHLEFEADDLTIHGLEGPGQVPYAHIDRLFVRLQILSFFRAKIGLNYLEGDHPVLHLIVYPDGSTNQPRPKQASTGNSKDEIFNLAIGRTVIDNGVAILNQRAIPFNLTVDNLAAQVSYVPARDHYVGTLHAEDVLAQRGADLPVHSMIDASVDIGRNTANLVSLTLQSGPQGKSQKTVLRASGNLNNFASPQWQFSMKGAIDALEVRALTGLTGLAGGTAQIEASGHGSGPQFVIDGNGRISGGAYRTGTVNAGGVTADAVAHVTQDQIAVTGIHARLATGGVLTGEMHILNWNSPAPAANSQPVAQSGQQQGIIRTRLAGFTLDSLLDTVAPPHFRRLGYATTASGTANIDWTGSVENMVGVVNVSLTPPATTPAHEVPVTGEVNAEYRNRAGAVIIHAFEIHTPASEIQVSGSMGVYPLTRPSKIDASLVTRDLAEFNPALGAFGIAVPGEANPIPAELHGQAQFHGTVTGNLRSPEFKGHLQATDFNITALGSNPTANEAASHIHFDSLATDAAYRAGELSVSLGTLVQGKTTIDFSGQIRGRTSRPKELFADSSSIHASVQVRNADITQWMALTGKSYPISGTLNLHAQTGGTIGDLDGTGQLTVAGGSVYGEQYRSLTTDVQFRGKDVNANNLVFLMDGGRITGNGGYNFTANTAHADLQGSGFELAHIRRLENHQYPVLGDVDFTVKGSGTLDNPSLQANVHVRNLELARQFKGLVDAEAHTQGRALQMHVAAHLNSSTLDLTSQTQIAGDYQTQAKLDIAGFNIDPLLQTFSVTGIRGSSSIAGAITVSGPLRRPKQLNGDVRLSQLAVTLEDVPIHSEGELHASLRDGTFSMDPVHIVGPDTNLTTEGSLGVFDPAKPIHGSAKGSINMSLAQTLDTDIISSGHVDFSMNAEGTVDNPDLTGNVKFTNVNVALEDYVNGLSRMNGELVFDQNRLDFKNVTAYSGGGLIKIGGFVTYHRGLYADLTADAKDVRIRYPEGITSTASAKIRVQGSQAGMIVSGRVMLTGFAVNPDVDFASLAGKGTGVSLPPNPNSPTNKVALDIRVVSAPSLNFQNSFARLAGNVDLAVRGTLAQPSVLGRVTVTEGTATFNGEKFELQHGEIYFSNPVRIQPVLDLTATTNVENYTITIAMQGSTSKLTPSFRSEPPLSEQDIFSLLAMGRTQEEQQIYSTAQSQAGVNTTADSLLGGALNATISNRIQKLFGGGSVRIDPTFVSGIGNATARITVEEPVSKTATLTYATNVNSTAEQLIQGEWRMTPNFSVVAVRDESGVFSLIFRLHRSYH